MAKVTTVNDLLLPMMGKPSKRTVDGRCVICGRYPNGAVRVEDHHIVRRGAGKAYDDAGHELSKPTIAVCGLGNNLHDADGRMLCHGALHHGYYHLRWHPDTKGMDIMLRYVPPASGYWEILKVKEPCDYQTALGMKGWKRLECHTPVGEPECVTFGDGKPKEPGFIERQREERKAFLRDKFGVEIFR